MKKPIIGILCITLLIVSSLTVNAEPTHDKINKSMHVEISKDGKDRVITSSNKVTDKIKFEAEVNEFLGQEVMSLATTINLKDSDRYDYNGSYCQSEFDSDVTYSVITDLRVNGTSKAKWMGSNPVNCDNIKLEDSFTITGVAVSITLGSDWSVTGGLTSKTGTWSKDYDDEWIITHNYSNLDFNGYELYIKQKARGYYTFGTTTHDTSAVDSTLL
ncbi:hypothetical protein [Paramaledivibacter caminithermalis]|jgi:uncharacterized protein YxeA|uniref:Uncharacterized protein n=1 Tax=Paramaledivibacter caminithermalis (strain DSM 15212 / CIP 107654 / DViRD3) TaxID=1121301 RepID=A0A1M6TPR6_PARC5|nr:hypothetical protein [Paramaledivibacter caminithermalis]SHK58910.1 hypothetical protein SAMN02745912_03751 [Paramaledivibacter caminithermalis DSM 15212]